MKKSKIYSLLVLLLIISFYSCEKVETKQLSTKLLVKTNVVGYGHVKNVIVDLVDKYGNYVDQKTTNNIGEVVFEDLQSGMYAVDCEYIIIDKQVDYITNSDNFLLTEGDYKIIEVTVD